MMGVVLALLDTLTPPVFWATDREVVNPGRSERRRQARRSA